MTTRDYFSTISNYAAHLKKMELLFQNWGYKATLLPLIDTEHSYAQLLSETSHNYYRTLNTNRELMMFRTDSTLFLSKILGTHLHDTLLPLRLYYSNSVLQSSTEHEIEYWQSGVELIGVSSLAAEFEIISLLYTSIATLLDAFRIHIGSRKLVQEIIRHDISQNKSTSKKSAKHEDAIETSKSTPDPVSISPLEKDIFKKISRRDITSLGDILSARAIECIFSIADNTTYDTWKKKVADCIGTSNDRLLDFTAYFEALLEIDAKQRIRCDLTELGTHNYYTDTVYTAYISSIASPLAHGGRYDSLLNTFGFDAPAIGFTLFPHYIADRLVHKEGASPSPFSSLSSSPRPDKKQLLSTYHTLSSKQPR